MFRSDIPLTSQLIFIGKIAGVGVIILGSVGVLLWAHLAQGIPEPKEPPTAEAQKADKDGNKPLPKNELE